MANKVVTKEKSITAHNPIFSFMLAAYSFILDLLEIMIAAGMATAGKMHAWKA